MRNDAAYEGLVSPLHRFVLLDDSFVLATSDEPLAIAVAAWGYATRGLVVLDYEIPIPVPCGSLAHLVALLGSDAGYPYTCPECCVTLAGPVREVSRA